jgi:hypothetical protein
MAFLLKEKIPVSLGDINTFAPVPEFVPLVVLCPDYQI